MTFLWKVAGLGFELSTLGLGVQGTHHLATKLVNVYIHALKLRHAYSNLNKGIKVIKS